MPAGSGRGAGSRLHPEYEPWSLARPDVGACRPGGGLRHLGDMALGRGPIRRDLWAGWGRYLRSSGVVWRAFGTWWDWAGFGPIPTRGRGFESRSPVGASVPGTEVSGVRRRRRGIVAPCEDALSLLAARWLPARGLWRQLAGDGGGGRSMSLGLSRAGLPTHGSAPARRRCCGSPTVTGRPEGSISR